MMITGTQALVVGAALSATAAVAHLACILIGAPAYRLMGAGERHLSRQGDKLPASQTCISGELDHFLVGFLWHLWPDWPCIRLWDCLALANAVMPWGPARMSRAG